MPRLAKECGGTEVIHLVTLQVLPSMFISARYHTQYTSSLYSVVTSKIGDCLFPLAPHILPWTILICESS
jgi:hypothetical protein